ncbi:HEAT repeat domain-containing protein [Streptomyces bobili]|uniref:HEAT repeat domain-containing protein n=1 Tax=Streptomyces bobili TaxID=67280 RepID=UPI003701963A
MSDAPSPFEQRTLEFFLNWAEEEEEHPDVLAEVLGGLGHHEDPRVEPLGLSYLTHPASKVRARVPSTLEHMVSDSSGRWTYTPVGLDAMLVLARDTDASIRKLVAHRLAESRDPAPAVGDVLADLLDEEDQVTRIWAVFGLAERDDPRCVGGASRVGPIDDHEAWSWILGAPSRYAQRQKEREAPVTTE